MLIELEKRRSGRTMGLILETIGKAIGNPGITMVSCDHAIHHPFGVRILKGIAEEMIKKLDLNMDVKINGCSLEITSLHKPVFVGNDGHLYQRTG